MNRIKNIGLFIIFAFVLTSCSNDIDNYDAPNGGIYGTIYDKETNQPIPLPVEGSGGSQVSLFEINTDATASLDFRAKLDGTYMHTKVFNGDYRVKVDGPFVGVCEGYVTINGQTELNLYAIPLSRVSISASVSEDNKLTVNFEALKSDNSFTLSDVSVMWNYTPGVDLSANYATLSSKGGNATGTHVFDLGSDEEFIKNHFKIKSNGNRVYVRVSATVEVIRNSKVEATGTNYSKIIEVVVKDIK